MSAYRKIIIWACVVICKSLTRLRLGTYPSVDTRVSRTAQMRYQITHIWYGVATMSSLLQIIGLFCRISSLFYRALLQKRPIILRSLLIVAISSYTHRSDIKCGPRMRSSHSFRMRSAQRVVKSLGISWRYKSWSTNSTSRTSMKSQFHIRNPWEVLWYGVHLLIKDEVRPMCSKIPWNLSGGTSHEVPIPYLELLWSPNSISSRALSQKRPVILSSISRT